MNIEGKHIFMVVNYDKNDASNGLTKKICSEIQTLRKMGASVFYSAYQDNGIFIFGEDDQIIYKKEQHTKTARLRRGFRRFLLLDTVYDYLKSTKTNFEIGYLRNLGFDKKFIRIIKTMKDRDMRVILDVMSWTPQTKVLNLNRGPGFFFISSSIALNKSRVARYIDLVVEEGNDPELFGCKAVSFVNGINVGDCRVHNYLGCEGNLNLISVSNEQIYHGYDRLLKSILNYYKNPNIPFPLILYLVGEMSARTRRLANCAELRDRVFLTGKLSGSALDEIYDKCNIAVGPVGSHRDGGKKDTGLKTKEYFARGIPYFYSGEELLPPPDYPYVMRIPSDESLINFQDVFAFWKRVKDVPDYAKQMRDFAKNNYSWDMIMKNVFNALD